MYNCYKMKIRGSVSLKNHTTFKIGGKARYFLEAKTQEDLIKSINWANERKVKYFILGWGSNVLFSDKGFNGLVIKNSIKSVLKTNNKIFASSGLLVSELVDFYARNGFSGLEWAGGLPGTLGGAIYGNAGSFGEEIKDLVIEVASLMMDKKGGVKVIKRDNEKCRFGYRVSVFKGCSEVILGAWLKYAFGDKREIKRKVNHHISYRKKRQPLEYPSAGSAFKNIPLAKINGSARVKFKSAIKTDPFPVIPAAAVINDLGLKGKTIGGAQISEKHPNFIINIGNASAKDVKKLAEFIKKQAYKNFRVKLEEEIKIVEY